MQILEGIKNRVFLNQKVEEIADERMAICKECPNLDTKGKDCMVPGTQPCCKLCGCSMALKTRVLSAKCDDDRWHPVLSEEEEDIFNTVKDDKV